jgi:hypothetical protein
MEKEIQTSHHMSCVHIGEVYLQVIWLKNDSDYCVLCIFTDLTTIVLIYGRKFKER